MMISLRIPRYFAICNICCVTSYISKPKSHAKHLWCKKGAAKYNRIIPASECMNRLAITNSDIRMQSWFSILNTL